MCEYKLKVQPIPLALQKDQKLENSCSDAALKVVRTFKAH